MEDKGRFVDQLLDSALAHRRAAEPRPGLEGRILERVRATAGEEIAGAKAWKLWIAAAATVVVVVFVAIRVANRLHSPAFETSHSANVVPPASPRDTLAANSGTAPRAGNATTMVEPKRTARRDSTRSRRVKAHHWPSQFPTQAPLTAEQKALVRYVQKTPPRVLAEPILKAEFTVQPLEITPLTIPPLKIKPMAAGPAGEENN